MRIPKMHGGCDCIVEKRTVVFRREREPLRRLIVHLDVHGLPVQNGAEKGAIHTQWTV